MAVFLTIGSQGVNQLFGSSGVFYGENVQQGWDSASRTDISFIVLGFLNTDLNNVNIINDSDLIDEHSFEPNVYPMTAPVILKAN